MYIGPIRGLSASTVKPLPQMVGQGKDLLTRAGSRVVRIDLLCFLARCRKGRLNQALTFFYLSVVFSLCCCLLGPLLCFEILIINHIFIIFLILVFAQAHVTHTNNGTIPLQLRTPSWAHLSHTPSISERTSASRTNQPGHNDIQSRNQGNPGNQSPKWGQKVVVNRTYAVPLLHAHGDLHEMVCVGGDGPQSTVAVRHSGRHALATVAVQRRLLVEVIALAQHRM